MNSEVPAVWQVAVPRYASTGVAAQSQVPAVTTPLDQVDYPMFMDGLPRYRVGSRPISRATVLKVARVVATLVDDQGVFRPSMNQLAREAGVSRMTAQHVVWLMNHLGVLSLVDAPEGSPVVYRWTR